MYDDFDSEESYKHAQLVSTISFKRYRYLMFDTISQIFKLTNAYNIWFAPALPNCCLPCGFSLLVFVDLCACVFLSVYVRVALRQAHTQISIYACIDTHAQRKSKRCVLVSNQISCYLFVNC